MTTTTKPCRIQRKRSDGWKLPEGALCVTRPGKWGNPFKAGETIASDSPLWPYASATVPGGTRGLASIRMLRAVDVIAAYAAWFYEQPGLMTAAWDELGGRALACFCKVGDPCPRGLAAGAGQRHRGAAVDAGRVAAVTSARTPPGNPGPATVRAWCPQSLRADGGHGWEFEGDDPYIRCEFCGEVRDALTGETCGGQAG